MSADNGVYILKTKGPEYRVAHTTNIDDIDYGISEDQFNIEFVEFVFGKSFVYFDFEDAKEKAAKWAEEIEASGPLEYGICILDYEDIKFPK
jgi:hypothetical protein